MRAAFCTVVVLGLFLSQPPFDALSLLLKEVRVVGSMTYGHGAHRADVTLALQMLSANIAVVKDLVTHRFELENIFPKGVKN
jgi:hypothetical protein